MVTKIERFEDTVSGKTFATEEEAKISEDKSLDIQNTFKFYEPIEDDEFAFGNGGCCIQRTEEFYNHLLDALVEMIKKYEPWIAREFIKKGSPLSREVVKGYSFIGRYLDDCDSDMYHWWGIQGNICPVCFREYGQMYYALHCKHDDTIPSKKGEGKNE